MVLNFGKIFRTPYTIQKENNKYAQETFHGFLVENISEFKNMKKLSKLRSHLKSSYAWD